MSARATRSAAAFTAMFSLIVASAFRPSDDPPVLFRSDFSRDDLKAWTFTDPDAWRVAEHDGKRILEQYKASKHQPKVRSPLNIALVPGVDAGSFALDAKVRSTTRDYGHRDVCFFFGYQDASHFYYVHLAKEADEHAHSIFLVNGADRVSIAQERTRGHNWTDAWHTVRIVRDADTGKIEVYADDQATPMMTALDKTFTHGRIGVGTFDDTAQFAELAIRGKAHQATADEEARVPAQAGSSP